MFLKCYKARRIPVILTLLSLLVACGSDSDSPKRTEFNLSGTVYIERDSDIDSDVGDDETSFVTNNNSIATAQSLTNPTTMGGYVSGYAGFYPFSGIFERDIVDYFEATLLEGQRINLSIFYADEILDNVDVQLLLRSTSQPNVVVESLDFNSQSAQSLLVPQSDDYYIEIRTIAGFSDPVLYSLSISRYLISSTAMPVSVQNIVPGEVIVQFKDQEGVSAQATSLEATTEATTKHIDGMKLAQRLGKVGLYKREARSVAQNIEIEQGDISSVPDSDTKQRWETWELAQQLSQRDDVLLAEPNYRYRSTVAVTEPEYPQQWNLQMLEMPSAWEISSGAGVTVAVIDSGIAASHLDLTDNILTADGYDFIANASAAGDSDGPDSNPEDEGQSFHGSHVSGIIAANGRNNLGITGIAFDADIMPLRVIDVNDEATSFDIANAILYAAQLSNSTGLLPATKADVINLSLGGPERSSFLGSAIQSAIDEGVIIVAAAGNNNSFELFYPAAYDGVVGVGSVNSDKSRSSFSNFGSFVDVVAPGGSSFVSNQFGGFQLGILSTIYASEYTEYQGTSMSAPHVAGIAALMKAYDSDVNHSVFQAAIVSESITDDLGPEFYDEQYGFGLINASKAMSWLEGDISDQLAVFPQSLGFIGADQTIDLTLTNPGQGAIVIDSITSNRTWIDIADPINLPNGLQYAVSADVVEMGGAIGEGQIDVLYRLGGGAQQSRSVNVLVANTTVADDTIGNLSVILVDQQNPTEAAELVRATPGTNGSYHFSFEDIPRGDYFIYASTENDQDGFYIDEGEARGGYPFFFRRELIELNRDVSNLNFGVQFQTLVQTSQSLSSEGDVTPISVGTTIPEPIKAVVD